MSFGQYFARSSVLAKTSAQRTLPSTATTKPTAFLLRNSWSIACSLSVPPYCDSTFATCGLANTLAYEVVPQMPSASVADKLEVTWTVELRPFAHTCV